MHSKAARVDDSVPSAKVAWRGRGKPPVAAAPTIMLRRRITIIMRSVALDAKEKYQTRHAAPSNAETAVLQLFHAAGKKRLCGDSYDLRRLDVAEEDAIAALEALQDKGLLQPGERDDAIALTERGRSVVQDMWPRGQLPDASGPRRVIGHFYGEWDLPVRIAVPVENPHERLPRTVSLERELVGQVGGFSAWVLMHPSTGQKEDGLLVGLHDRSGTAGGHPGNTDDDWVCFWLSVDQEGNVRERRKSLEEIVFLIAMGAA